MQAFFGDYQKYSYTNLQYLLQPIGTINKQRIENGKPPLTVILIHHTNSKNDTFGGVSFGQIVTDVLRLSKANNNRIRIELIRSRNYCENNACEVEMVFETEKSVVFKGPFEISHKNSDSCNKKKTMKELVLEEIDAYKMKEMPFDYINERMKEKGFTSDGSVTNVLTSLKKLGVISQGPKGWETIIINNKD